MSTWRIGDSWITTSGLTVGTGGGKLASQEDMQRRKKRKAKRKRPRQEAS